jgi:hypothetical protein
MNTTLVVAHSEREGAAAMFKRRFGFQERDQQASMNLRE